MVVPSLSTWANIVKKKKNTPSKAIYFSCYSFLSLLWWKVMMIVFLNSHYVKIYAQVKEKIYYHEQDFKTLGTLFIWR